MRPARYRDMVILTRSIQGTAEVFATVLAREGIPAHVGTREGYFSAQEVSLVLDYLQVLLNRQQDIPLTAVIASPIGGLDSEELAKIRVRLARRSPSTGRRSSTGVRGRTPGSGRRWRTVWEPWTGCGRRFPIRLCMSFCGWCWRIPGTGIMRQPCRGAPSGEPTWKCWWRRPVGFRGHQL